MRIIAGLAKGMSLVAPKHGDTRPTSDRVREAVFSGLGERVVGADVLDLFAGTGALGLEAASRGARAVTFVETASAARRSLQQNIETLRSRPDVRCPLVVSRGEALYEVRRFAAARQMFSLIFADPPYGETAEALLSFEPLAAVLTAEGLFVLERAKRDTLVVQCGWKLLREATYGDTKVSFLAKG